MIQLPRRVYLSGHETSITEQLDGDQTETERELDGNKGGVKVRAGRFHPADAWLHNHPGMKDAWECLVSFNFKSVHKEALTSLSVFPCYQADIFPPLPLNSDRYCEHSMSHYQELLIH